MKRPSITPKVLDSLANGKIYDVTRPGLFIEAKAENRVWRYYRRIPKSTAFVKMTLGAFPAYTIPAAREWADGLNMQVEAGIDPRAAMRSEKAQEAQTGMTVADAYALYWIDIQRKDRRVLKVRTLYDKERIWKGEIEPRIGSTALAGVTADQLHELVEAKGEKSATRANRLAAELKVIFKWFGSRPAQRAGIKLAVDPAATLSGKTFAEPRSKTRYLKDGEITLFFRAVAEQPDALRRAWTLLLLTGTRISEAFMAKRDAVQDGIWTIPAGDEPGTAKNWQDHAIPLGAWGLSLTAGKSRWLFSLNGRTLVSRGAWYRSISTIRDRMDALNESPLPFWTPHDLRRTLRSNTRSLGIDFETAEAMLNHAKQGLEARYDVEDMLDAKRIGFAKWEEKLVEIARKAKLEDQLGITKAVANPTKPELPSS